MTATPPEIVTPYPSVHGGYRFITLTELRRIERDVTQSRAAQGLPPTIEDPATLDRLVAMLTSRSLPP